MEEKITKIKNWLGTGSINVFGLPLSGKDTVGIRLAQDIGGRLLSSGVILRAAMTTDEALTRELNHGQLASSYKFKDIVLPYFSLDELSQVPLILSSVGRWSGEEEFVISAAEKSGHQIKAVILLNISENEIKKRWQIAQTTQDRGPRADDAALSILNTRIEEFTKKTMPVVNTYRDMGLLINVSAHASRDEVYMNTIDGLVDFIDKNS